MLVVAFLPKKNDYMLMLRAFLVFPVYYSIVVSMEGK
jgi:hypothetical protein